VTDRGLGLHMRRAVVVPPRAQSVCQWGKRLQLPAELAPREGGKGYIGVAICLLAHCTTLRTKDIGNN